MAMRFMIEIECDGCKAKQRIGYHGMPREDVERIAGLMDGTSPLYVHPVPRGPAAVTSIGKCELCGDSFRARVVDDPKAAA